MLRIIKFLVLMLVATHLITLTKSPVPWFDETYFASLCKSLSEGRGFNADVCPLMEAHYPQAKAYGPGYLFTNALIIKVFGHGILQNRILGLLFGLAAAWLWYVVARCLKVNTASRWVGIFILLSDAVYGQSMHAGRMDTMALAFMWVAYYAALQMEKGNGQKLWQYSLLAGAASAMCLLTSPRPAIILVGFWAGYFLVKWLLQGLSSWRQAVLIAAIPAISYLIWMYVGFGGVVQWFNYFFAPSDDPINPEMNTLVSMYVGKRFHVPTYQWVVIAPALITLPFAWRVWNKVLLGGTLLALLSFYTLIIDTGIYSVLVLPYWLLLLLFNLDKGDFSFIEIKNKWLQVGQLKYLVALLIGSAYAVKLLFVIITYPERNQEALAKFCASQLHPGARVVGEDKFYYAVVNTGGQFQYLMRGSHGHRRREYHFNEFNFEYLFVSAQPDQNHQWHMDYYGEWADWQKVAHYNPSESIQPWRKKLIELYLARFPTLAYSTEGVLYKRVDKPLAKQ